MTNIFTKLVSTLKSYSTLTAIVPTTQIYVGATDVIVEKQAELLMPQINIHLISDVYDTVPLNSHECVVQIDIWSRLSQLQIEQIHDAVIGALNYYSGDSSATHIFWQRQNSGVDMYESDRRIYHRSVDFVIWAQD